jgi:hypothetical protein
MDYRISGLQGDKMQNKYFTEAQVLEEAGIVIAPGLEAAKICKKIVEDSHLRNLAWGMSIDAFLLEALRSLPPHQLETLRKRVGFSQEYLHPPPANWAIVESASGVPALLVRTANGSASQIFQCPQAGFSGRAVSVEDIDSVLDRALFGAEKIPTDLKAQIRELWRQACGV